MDAVHQERRGTTQVRDIDKNFFSSICKIVHLINPFENVYPFLYCFAEVFSFDIVVCIRRFNM